MYTVGFSHSLGTVGARGGHSPMAFKKRRSFGKLMWYIYTCVVSTPSRPQLKTRPMSRGPALCSKLRQKYRSLSGNSQPYDVFARRIFWGRRNRTEHYRDEKCGMQNDGKRTPPLSISMKMLPENSAATYQ
jgi:hypothetical protein